MSHKTRTILGCVGLALNALGAICLALSTSGCSGPFPSGRINVNACSGAACEPTQPPPPAPRP